MLYYVARFVEESEINREHRLCGVLKFCMKFIMKFKCCFNAPFLSLCKTELSCRVILRLVQVITVLLAIAYTHGGGGGVLG